MDIVMRIGALILMAYATVLFCVGGDKQIATYLMAQSAVIAAMVKWGE